MTLTLTEAVARLQRYEAALGEIAHGPCAVQLTQQLTTDIMNDMMRIAQKALTHECLLDEGFIPLTDEDMPERRTVVMVRCVVGDRHMAFWDYVRKTTDGGYENGMKRQWYDYEPSGPIEPMVETPLFWRLLIPKAA